MPANPFTPALARSADFSAVVPKDVNSDAAFPTVSLVALIEVLAAPDAVPKFFIEETMFPKDLGINPNTPNNIRIGESVAIIVTLSRPNPTVIKESVARVGLSLPNSLNERMMLAKNLGTSANLARRGSKVTAKSAKEAFRMSMLAFQFSVRFCIASSSP
ncbi:hypothetical protein [Acinetobacter baumannii]|uniref:hypothetical protein n=1 Tax=Acinetobacter baumannii TaxID=470 RepID=UPI001D172610|nr:hypothetical protein [Acinetobacter baumannii]